MAKYCNCSPSHQVFVVGNELKGLPSDEFRDFINHWFRGKVHQRVETAESIDVGTITCKL
jgi:hypothetical protein